MSAKELPLRPILAKVSRSFYLSLALLPAPTRSTVALAYLLARAADTVADTRLVGPERRRELLDDLRGACAGTLPREDRVRLLGELGRLELSDDSIVEEQALLAELGSCLAALEGLPALEQALVRQVLHTLTSGMAADLTRFGAEDSGEMHALDTRAELFHYCYQVAGCVGEFWSRVHAARLPRVRQRVRADLSTWVAQGVRLGRALQLTNVLRDVRRDLEHGRCYLPREELSELGLAPRDLLDPGAWERLRPLYESLVAQALDDAYSGIRYTLRIPSHALTLRLAGLLPLLLAVRTLGVVLQGNPLGAPAKVSRGVVYASLARGLLAARDERAVQRLFRATLRQAGLQALTPSRARYGSSS
jgi:farnesyl-diphosphate farnesyltransferase